MRKNILSVEIKKTSDKHYGFAFFPKIVIEAHPTHRRWHLIWLEAYEISMSKNWLIEK